MMILKTIIIFNIAFLLVELLQRKTGIKKEVSRKFSHVIGAVGASLLPCWLDWTQISVVASIFVVFMLISKRLRILRSIHDVKRKSYGEVYMPLSVLLLSIFFQDKFTFTTSLVILAISDIVAEIIGSKYGKNKIKRTGKSLQGSVGFFISTFIIVIVFLALFASTSFSVFAILSIAIAVSMTTTLAEAFAWSGTDNVTIPLISAISLSLLI